MHNQRLEWIQALRGVAALLVLLFHLDPYWAETPRLASVFSPFFRWGFAGVDIFFVLSGFVVYRAATRAVAAGEIGLFVRQRLVRIYAGYWPALAVFSLVSLVLLRRPSPSPEQWLFSISLFQPQLENHWLMPAWSLTLELYFYAWVLGLVLLQRSRPHSAIIVAVMALVAWNLGWMLLNPAVVSKGEQPLETLLTAFGIEFLLGALLSEAFDFARRHVQRLDASVALLWLTLAVLAAGTGVTARFVNVEVLRVATFGLGALALVAGGLCLELAGWRAPRWLCRIGDASYGLYLLHISLLAVFHVGWVLLGGRADPGGTLSLLYMLLVPAWIVLLSLVWYRWVEQPLLRAALNTFARRREGRPSLARPGSLT